MYYTVYGGEGDREELFIYAMDGLLIEKLCFDLLCLLVLACA